MELKGTKDDGVREAAKKKTFFLGDLSQMWMGGVADSQTMSKPLHIMDTQHIGHST